ncbi:MAG: sulfatase-like hydrolase/transferase [Thermodesulfobacteriota bacterium]
MTRFRKSIVFAGISLLIFSCARLLLLLLYPDTFSELNLPLTALAFLNGVRFDLSILTAIFIIPLGMMNLPLSWFGKKWFDAWAWALFALLIPSVLVLAGDLIYFSFVHRHIADELLLLGNDFGFIVGMASREYLPGLIACLTFALLLGWIWKRVLSVEVKRSGHLFVNFLILVAASLLCLRGSVDRKPLGIVDAYRSGNTAFGTLSLNGIFSAVHSSLERKALDYRFFADNAAYDALGLKNGDFPMLKSFEGAGPSGLNLVFVLLESWDVAFLDSYEGSGQGITPNFDALAAESIKFENCYATCQRSVQSIQSILTGIPPVTGQPEIGWGLEQSNMTKIGKVAKDHGYATIFVQSSRRRSYRLDAVAGHLGFEHYSGQEDIPLKLDYPEKNPKWGWDYETLMFSLEEMDSKGRPFMAFVFTGTTHAPYADAGQRFVFSGQAKDKEAGFINALHYADWSLGEFMAAARSRPWFDRTVFILTADHAWRSKPGDDPRMDFRIPFIIYAPRLLEPRVVTAVCSHLDCLPTMFDLLGFKEPYAAAGESLLRRREGYALVKKGDLMGIVAGEGSLTHNLQNRLNVQRFSENLPDAYFDGLEKILMSAAQVTGELVHENRWAPPYPGRP